MRKWITKEDLRGYAFASPWLIGFACITVYSIVAASWFSLTEYNVMRPPVWVGLENYQMLVNDQLFWKSLSNTAFYTFLGVPIWIAVGLLLAVLLNQNLKGMDMYRTIFYLPTIVPAVASSVIWMWILNPQYGLLNTLLRMIGINGPGWLASETWAKPGLILMGCWGAGGNMIVFLAQLQNLPTQLYEAADLDGANAWHKFRSITVPLMTPTIFFNLITGIIGSFQVFTQAYVMTNGGPANATLFYVLYLFNNAFKYFKMGYASAMAVILFVIVLIVTIFINTTSRYWVHYEI